MHAQFTDPCLYGTYLQALVVTPDGSVRGQAAVLHDRWLYFVRAAAVAEAAEKLQYGSRNTSSAAAGVCAPSAALFTMYMTHSTTGVYWIVTCLFTRGAIRLLTAVINANCTMYASHRSAKWWLCIDMYVPAVSSLIASSGCD